MTDFSHPPGPDADYGAHLGIARLGFSAIGTNNPSFPAWRAGRQIGTNRSITDSADWNVVPHPSDTFLPMNGTSKFKIDSVANHPGGLQTFGWHVVGPVQRSTSDLHFLLSTPSDSKPYVYFYDPHDPTSPRLTSRFLSHVNAQTS